MFFWDTRWQKIGNALNDPKLNFFWTLCSQTYFKYSKHLPQRPKIWSVFFLDDWLFPRNKVVKNRKFTEWPQTELNSQNYSLCTKNLYQRAKIWYVSLYHQRFQRYKIAENQTSIEWPQTEFEHLTVKSTLYILNTYPWGPNFRPFRSTISRCWDTTCTRTPKIRKAPNDPKLNLKT